MVKTQQNLCLFFTCGVSLQTWQDIGSLEREIKPYVALAKQFDNVYFFTYGKKSDLDFQNVLPSNIVVLPKKSFLPNCLYGFFLPFFYWKILKNSNILKTNQMASAIPAVIAKIFFGQKFILRNGYEWLNVLQKENKAAWKRAVVFLWEKIAYKFADIVIFTSQKDKDFAQTKFKIPQRKIRIVANYIDTDLFKPQDIAKEKGRVVFVGRLSREKNLFNLIECLVGLPVKLVLIGSGDLKNDLENFAKEKKVNAEFKGNVPNNELPNELNKAQVFVLPSLYEGCPKALLEAMACGLPCVSSDVEGIKEIITHNQNGYLCQTEPFSIRQAIIQVLSDENLRKRLGENAQQTIKDNFGLEQNLQKETMLYLDLKVLILAGGRGMRLWPLSRDQKPKQFQKLVSSKTMLQETVWRLSPEVSWPDIFISTNTQYAMEVQKELPKIAKDNIIVEPMSRERAASLLLFLATLPKVSYNQPILVLPSDHLIKDIPLFKKAVFAAQNFVKQNPDYIFILGATPNFPDTGLGYVKKGPVLENNDLEIYQAQEFVEKPNLQRATDFIESKNYFWNTAIYVFTPELILRQIKKFLPDNYQHFLNIQKAINKSNFQAVLEREYKAMDQVPLEFNVLENYEKKAVAGIDMGWSDIGSWSVLKDCLSNSNQNFATVNHIDMESQNVMVYGASDKQLVATVGVRDLVVVITDDIVLVCNKNESQKVKQLAEKLEKEQKVKYL